ncbi:MAG: HAMP domain-containing protein [Wenzhouxiangella sp.]|nr:HAMP domain-containing protein [Wenzhouxiangella sp.]TVR96126.1 MAG: HAMP domain-containing protein [Wenzhouxiangellaceae bacterium]
MSRLYLRIFLSFWAVIVLTVGAVILINWSLEQAQRDEVEWSGRALRLADGMERRAGQALAREGVEGLVRWAERSPERGRRIRIFILDRDGHELRGQRLPWELRSLARDWRRTEALPETPRRGQVVATVSDPQHGRFLVILTPPPEPLVLRLFGGLGGGGLLALAMLFSGLICLWLARSITRPIGALKQAGQALGDGELAARADRASTARGDELGDLARDFNRMADRLQVQIERQRQLLRDVSHELRSPLARLRVALTLAADSASADKRADYLARMESDIERLDGLIDEILRYVRLKDQPGLERQHFDLTDKLTDLAESARLEGSARGIVVKLEAPAQLIISGDAELLGRALENVLRNALRHSPAGGEVELLAEATDAQVSIHVLDRGPGVPPERLEDIFEPFMRLNEARDAGGSGIGLAIARAAIELHGGNIRARNRPDGGLKLSIELSA